MFLDQTCNPTHAFLASLMRSGNTLIRKLAEQITGISTGSNFSNLSDLNAALAVVGFRGEYIGDNRIWL